jgi:hypothetical protein
MHILFEGKSREGQKHHFHLGRLSETSCGGQNLSPVLF